MALAELFNYYYYYFPFSNVPLFPVPEKPEERKNSISIEWPHFHSLPSSLPLFQSRTRTLLLSLWTPRILSHSKTQKSHPPTQNLHRVLKKIHPNPNPKNKTLLKSHSPKLGHTKIHHNPATRFPILFSAHFKNHTLESV